MNQETAEAINKLGAFCGKRDVAELTRECLMEKFGIAQADVMVLFGGSILAGGDLLAEAMKQCVAKKYLIVGGAGHTTETLRRKVREENPQIETEGLSEAEVFQKYLWERYRRKADGLETESTNCGNNITYLLELLKREAIPCRSIILCQDATMQRRMEAGLRKYVEDEVKIINYAAYHAEVVSDGDQLTYRDEIHGMWNIDRYVNLLMGEIPRLTDDEYGYGPKGKGYISHVEIPAEVQEAFQKLKAVYGEETRYANPLYASKEN